MRGSQPPAHDLESHSPDGWIVSVIVRLSRTVSSSVRFSRRNGAELRGSSRIERTKLLSLSYATQRSISLLALSASAPIPDFRPMFGPDSSASLLVLAVIGLCFYWVQRFVFAIVMAAPAIAAALSIRHRDIDPALARGLTRRPMTVARDGMTGASPCCVAALSSFIWAMPRC